MACDIPVGCYIVQREVLGCLVVTAVQCVAYLPEPEESLRVDIVIWRAAPECVLVYLYRVALRASIDHGAEAGLADFVAEAVQAVVLEAAEGAVGALLLVKIFHHREVDVLDRGAAEGGVTLLNVDALAVSGRAGRRRRTQNG